MKLLVLTCLVFVLAVDGQGPGPWTGGGSPLPCQYTKHENVKPVIPDDNNFIMVLQGTFTTVEMCEIRCGKIRHPRFQFCKSFYYDTANNKCTLLGKGVEMETNAEDGIDFYVKHCAVN